MTGIQFNVRLKKLCGLRMCVGIGFTSASEAADVCGLEGRNSRFAVVPCVIWIVAVVQHQTTCICKAVVYIV